MTRVTAWRRAAARSINAVLILYPCSIRWSFRKVVGTWPDPRSMPWADAFSSYVLRFLLSVIRSINDIQRVFDTLFKLWISQPTYFLCDAKNFFIMLYILVEFFFSESKLFWFIYYERNLSILTFKCNINCCITFEMSDSIIMERF